MYEVWDLLHVHSRWPCVNAFRAGIVNSMALSAVGSAAASVAGIVPTVAAAAGATTATVSTTATVVSKCENSKWILDLDRLLPLLLQRFTKLKFLKIKFACRIGCNCCCYGCCCSFIWSRCFV